MEIPKPAPAPELKRLDYFAGTWATEGEIKPGQMGSGGKFTGTNHVEWMDGAFFLVTHSEFNSAMGKGAETSYMATTATTRCTSTTLSTPWAKPTTPKAMWTETLGPGRARQGWAHRP